MKKIERVVYVCEGCGRAFATEEEALQCEERHQPMKRISKLFYNSEDRYPYGIEMEYADGKIISYRR